MILLKEYEHPSESSCGTSSKAVLLMVSVLIHVKGSGYVEVVNFCYYAD